MCAAQYASRTAGLLVNGFVAITPLTIDQTDYYGIPALSGLNWRLPGAPLPLPRPTAAEAEIHP